ncbi:MAG: DUF4115 domain-containing protein [Rhodospirillaceae bacterium]|nr:DUF4115 domain-containing protein [Rhodospirillaceae bacterium]
MNDAPDNTPHSSASAAGVSLEPPPQASDVGTLLCATRMRLGKDLQAVAGVLHIRYNFLVAIEDGRYEDLPGQAYAIGFVRAYADHLGLDGDEVVRRYKDETAGIKHKARFEYPIPAPESGIPSGALLLVAVVLGMMVYGVWYTMADADRRAAEVIQEVPERLAALLDGNSTAPASEAVQVEASGDTDETPVPPLVIASEDDSDESPAMSASPVAPLPSENPPAQVADVSPPVTEAAPEQKRPETAIAVAETAKPPTPAPLPAKAMPAASPAQAPSTPAVVVPPAAKIAAAPTAPPITPKSSIESKTPAVAQSDAAPKPISAETKPEVAPGAVQTAGPQPNQSRPSAPAGAPAPAAASTATATPAPPPASRPSTQVASAGKEAVELRAKSDSWIQIRDGEQLLLTRFLRKGESYKVPDRPGLTLMTLNAGGIDVLVNGEAMPPLGEPGSVARGVALDAQKLKSAAKPPAAN